MADLPPILSPLAGALPTISVGGGAGGGTLVFASGTSYLTRVFSVTGTPTSYQATGLPPGLEIDETTGIVYGMPTQAGTFQATFTAMDLSLTQSLTVSLTVSPDPNTNDIPTMPPWALLILALLLFHFAARAVPARNGCPPLPGGQKGKPRLLFRLDVPPLRVIFTPT